MTQQGKNAIDLVLAESLIELSAKKPIDKITIKEITDKAGVIRPTFYNHFQDKYELIDVYEYHKRKEYRKEIQIPLAHTGGDFYILCAVVVLYHGGLDSPGHG